MSSTKPLTSTNTESVLSQGTGCTSSILVTRSTLTCEDAPEQPANARRVHKTVYERVTYRPDSGKRARTIYLQNPCVVTAETLGEVLTGIEVDREGIEVHGQGFDERRHLIAIAAIVRRTPVALDLTTGTLEVQS